MGVDTARGAQLWLWRTHNEVNNVVENLVEVAQAAGYVYSDPDFPHPQVRIVPG